MLTFLADPSIIDALNEGHMQPPDIIIEQLEEEAALETRDMSPEDRLSYIRNYVNNHL